MLEELHPPVDFAPPSKGGHRENQSADEELYVVRLNIGENEVDWVKECPAFGG